MDLSGLFPGVQASALTDVGGAAVPLSYADGSAEYRALHESAGVADLSFRGRICLVGADRKRFLHGQVTNNVKDLPNGQGCYAALVTAKGKLQSDLYIYQLAEEILLDFEPGLTALVLERLEKYIIADDVQMVDVGSQYGLLTIQGPKAAQAISILDLGFSIPSQPLSFSSITHPELGEVYCMNHARGPAPGCDLFVPTAGLAVLARRLAESVVRVDGTVCGWAALEAARIEAGLPRFNADMEESNLAPEAAIEARAISYNKGCYIGQEVIARIRTYGQVAKALRGFRFDGTALPRRGDKLFAGEREVGYVTSAVHSPAAQGGIGLGYVRREQNAEGTKLSWRGEGLGGKATIVPLPFV